jgi:hypothetical protein
MKLSLSLSDKSVCTPSSPVRERERERQIKERGRGREKEGGR